MAKSKFGKKTKAKRKRRRKSSGGGKKSNAWRAYVGGGRVSNAPLPD
jgi:hypothetical protein